MGQGLYGKAGYNFVIVCVILINFGACIGYVRVVSELVTSAVNHLLGLSLSLEVYAILITAFVIMPLSTRRSLSKLQFTSILSLFFVVLFSASVIYSFASSEYLDYREGSIRWVVLRSDTLLSIGVLSFAYASHTNLVPIVVGMKKQKLKEEDLLRAIHASVAVVMGSYIVVALFGYLTFYDATDGDFLMSFPAEARKDPLILASALVLSISIVLTYPLALFPARFSLNNLLVGERSSVKHQDKLYLAEGIVMTLVALILAVAAPDITVILGLTGSTSSTITSSILPPLFFLHFVPDASTVDQRIAYFSIAVGTVCGIFGTFAALNDI